MRKRQLRPTPTSTLTRNRGGNTQLAQRRSDSNADADADADARLGGNGPLGVHVTLGGTTVLQSVSSGSVGRMHVSCRWYVCGCECGYREGEERMGG